MNATLTRRNFVVGSLGLLAACGTRERRASRVPRVGFMNGAMFTEMTAAFHDELQRLGYVRGENIVIEERLATTGSPGIGPQAAELAALDLDVIVAAALPHVLALRTAGATVPIVVATAPGLVANGFAASNERPGGNVTGLDELPPGLTARRLELLKTFAPNVRDLAVLSTTPGAAHGIQLADVEQAAARLGVRTTLYRAASPAELETALIQLEAGRHDGLLNFQGGLSLVMRQRIVDLANAQRMPAIYQSRLFVASGGLMSWAPDQNEQFRIAARLADRILRGERVGDIPIHYPERYFLTVNASTAARLGLELTPALRARIDELVA